MGKQSFKYFRTILTAFEEIIVPLWSITKLRADKEIGERLMKLRKLWTDNKYFSHEVEERFNMHIVEYKQVILSSQSNRLRMLFS